MIYHVIGLMSGSSLDGLDIAYVQLEETRGNWACQLLAAECIPYDEDWRFQLRSAPHYTIPEFLKLHTAYGHYTGKAVQAFIDRHELEHKVHFIASHGHTVLHDPAARTSFQLGDGAAIAAETALPVIADLRAMDVAHGGQGAPIVPIGDELLFPAYDYLLNLGGIANITIKSDGQYLAFDTCPCNQLLDYYATAAGLAFDEGGALAATGSVNPALLEALDSLAYYHQAPPKSLNNEFAGTEVLPVVNALSLPTEDALATLVLHIAQQIVKAIVPYARPEGEALMLVTGGGALNTFLIKTLQDLLAAANVRITVPDASVVQYKEAMVMALIGALRWREEENVRSSVTGASKDSIAGALWLGR